MLLDEPEPKRSGGGSQLEFRVDPLGQNHHRRRHRRLGVIGADQPGMVRSHGGLQRTVAGQQRVGIVSGITRGKRSNNGQPIGSLGQLRKRRTKSHSGQPGRDLADATADAARGIHVRVETLDLGRAALEEQQHHGLVTSPTWRVGNRTRVQQPRHCQGPGSKAADAEKLTSSRLAPPKTGISNDQHLRSSIRASLPLYRHFRTCFMPKQSRDVNVTLSDLLPRSLVTCRRICNR